MIEALIREYSHRYPNNEAFDVAEEMSQFPADLLAPPAGDLLLIRRAGETIAGGGFMYLDEESAELKRMWTSPDHRRQGLARRLLQALEGEIAARGYRRIYLTTGARQPEARQLYHRSGYVPLFDPTVDPEELGILAFEKEITPARSGLVPMSGPVARRQRELRRVLLLRQPVPEVRLRDLV